MIVHDIFQLFSNKLCEYPPSAIIKYSFFSHPVWPKWINVGKFVTFNESYTTYLALHSMLQDINHFPFLNKKAWAFRDRGIFVSIFYSAILLNFKVLYLDLNSQRSIPNFIFGESSFIWQVFCWVRVKIGITVEKVWMWSQMTVNRGLRVFKFL